MLSSKRIQVESCWRRTGCGGSALALSLRRIAQAKYRRVLYLLRQLIWKLKLRGKKALRRERSSAGLYSYDIQSYCRNFDEGGCPDDQISPLAPKH